MLPYFLSTRGRIEARLKGFFAAREADLAKVNALGPDLGCRLLDFSLQGKMIRGCLVSLGWALGSRDAAMDGAPAAVIDIGAAMELFQSGLLVHDDIMDRDATRRGKPAVYHQYAQAAASWGSGEPWHVGEAMGICAGDVAYFLAFELIAGADVTPGVRAALLALAARELTSVGVAQMQDVAWGGTPASAEEADILRMYTYKTSRYSFSLPLRAGAMAAGADPALQARLDEIGETIGVLFQVRDDELGLFGDEKEIGKPVGSDVREGKKTVYWARLMAAAAGADRDRLAATFGSREAGPADLAFVRGRAESLGVRAGIDAAMRALRERAESLIAAVSTGSPADRSALRDLLDFALARTL